MVILVCQQAAPLSPLTPTFPAPCRASWPSLHPPTHTSTQHHAEPADPAAGHYPAHGAHWSCAGGGAERAVQEGRQADAGTGEIQGPDTGRQGPGSWIHMHVCRDLDPRSTFSYTWMCMSVDPGSIYMYAWTWILDPQFHIHGCAWVWILDPHTCMQGTWIMDPQFRIYVCAWVWILDPFAGGQGCGS